ncbi:hypothetical protein VRU48_13725 [Pedobacter sp. KR3-3]|uniref:Uncharacterized protein n=1 Tax=Pedobacter albus TaxID=3113905 RepID=A0ABU7I9Z0_9SPHI|nr:hypothetical protein [Pedobacter sp. KR3-3]MEE1946177.1 hypothetical protein [Pedobacter sp. KR3-3]
MDLAGMNDLPEWDDFKHFRYDEEGEHWKNQPKLERAKNLYNQARQVYKYAVVFCETLKGEMADMTKSLIMQNAMMLCPKIMGAEGGDIYVLRMENASIIRTNARELETQVKASYLYENCSKSDRDVVVAEIDKFRELFKIWVQHFEKDDFEDDWGLY